MHLLELFETELTEAPPTDALKTVRLYHGTQRTSAAESILRTGLRPGMRTTYKGDLRPAAGKVYLTPDLYLAMSHALGSRWKTKTSNTFDDDHQYGYIFVVNGSDLTDVDPDEDAIGEFLWMYSDTRDGFRFDPRHEPDAAEREQIWDFIVQHGKKSDIRQSLELSPRRPRAWASLGKTLQPIMPDWMKLKFIEWGAPIAHHGSIYPSECWRIARADVHKLDEAASNFFEVAERIS